MKFSIEEKLDQIHRILERGLFFANYSKKYKELYKNKDFKSKNPVFKSSKRTIIVVQNVLYEQEALLNLQTLFSKDSREACFNSILKDRKDCKEYFEYKEIEEEYYKTPLFKFRNKIVAHKDSKNIGDPTTAFFNPIEDKWLEKTIYFYEKLNTFFHKNFDITVNNVFESWYKKSFDYFYEKLKEDEQPE